MKLQLAIFGFFVMALAQAQASFASGFSCKGPVGGKVGQCAIDFALKDLDGKNVRLSSFAGKVIFLNFWATWCAPCQVEIPEMEKANDKLKGSAFAMVSASIDTEGKPAIETYFKDRFAGKIPSFMLLLDTDKKVSEKYGTFKVPETYIIDGTGRIRDKIEGIKEWSDSLIIHYLELLAEK